MDQHEAGVFVNPKGKKIFIPLGNNPEVFEQLVHDLGVSHKLGFYDVYNIDEPDLMAMIPRPVHALIFIAAANIYHVVRENDGTKELTYDGSGDEEPIFWSKQTIGHACGLMALLHSISNGSAKQFVLPGSDLDLLLKECLPLSPSPRAAVLYNSKALERAHMAAAVKGDSSAPSSQEPNGYHFLAFVKSEKDDHLYELDGGWHGPIDRGLLAKDEDMLGADALAKGVRKFIDAAGDCVEFSMVALATKFDDA